MDANWTIWHTLNSDKYYPLQAGNMSSQIQNNTDHPMLIYTIGLHFAWMEEDWWWSKGCNVQIKPGEKVDLPNVHFTVELEANIGTHLYKPGVKYKLLTSEGWVDKSLSYSTPGDHVMVTEAPDRDFEVFISHSNSKEDIPLLEKTIEAFMRCGIKTYVAERSPQPGYPLWQKINAAIGRADAIVILWTDKGSQSGDVREEIGIAFGVMKTERIIPLVQTDLEIGGSLTGLEHVPLNKDNHIEALSIAVSRSLEWADEKEQTKPKITST